MDIFTSYAVDLLAEIFWCSADHEARDKDCEHYEDQHSVHARSHTAEDDFAEHDVGEQYHASERREGVVHAVHGAATCVCGHRGKEGGLGNSESNFFALHVSSRSERGPLLGDVVQEWMRLRFSPIHNGESRDEEHRHAGKDSPAMTGRARHSAQRYGQSRGDEEDGKHLQKV